VRIAEDGKGAAASTGWIVVVAAAHDEWMAFEKMDNMK